MWIWINMWGPSSWVKEKERFFFKSIQQLLRTFGSMCVNFCVCVCDYILVLQQLTLLNGKCCQKHGYGLCQCKFIYSYRTLSARPQLLCEDSSAIFCSALGHRDLHKNVSVEANLCKHLPFLIFRCVCVNISRSTLLRNPGREMKPPPAAPSLCPTPHSLRLKAKLEMVWL